MGVFFLFPMAKEATGVEGTPKRKKESLKEKRKAKKLQEKNQTTASITVKEEPLSPAPVKNNAPAPTTPRRSKKTKATEAKASVGTPGKSTKKQKRKSSEIEALPTGQLLASPSVRPSEAPVTKSKNGLDCFKEVRVEYPIHLPPSYIGSPLSGVLRVLGEHLMRYSRELDGVPLSMGPPGLLQTSAAIMSDLPTIHFTVTVKLLVFSPPVGSKLVGVVHQIGFDYIALLVFGTFNASILSRDLPHFVRDMEKDCWRHSTTGQTIEEGTRILFTVQEINKSTDSYSIIGSMKDPSTGVLPGKVLKKEPIEDQLEDIAEEEEEEPITPKSEKKTKKRKRSSSGKETPKKKKVK